MKAPISQDDGHVPLQYIQSVPHRKHHLCSDDKYYYMFTVLVNGCSVHCEIHVEHKSIDNPASRGFETVLVITQTTNSE